MVPFLVLGMAFALLRLVGLAGGSCLDDWQAALRGALALMFLLTTHMPMVAPGHPRQEHVDQVTRQALFLERPYR